MNKQDADLTTIYPRGGFFDQTGIRRWVDLFIIAVLAAVFSTASSRASSSIELQTFKTHTRLTVAVDTSTDIDWKDSREGFTLLLKGLASQDLVLDRAALKSAGDERVRDLDVKETDAGLLITGKWNFPRGDLAPQDPRMERFQYRERDPPSLVFDLWPKKGPTVGELKKLGQKNARLSAIRKAEEDAKRRQKQREEAEKALALISDVSRFCREPLKDQVDIFLPHYPVHEPIAFEKIIPQGTPDEGFPFIRPKASSPDAEYVNLALDLFAKKNYALTVKTIEFYEKERPASIHKNDMKLLKASSYLKLGHAARAKELFTQIREEQQTTPAALSAGIWLAEQTRREGDHIQTLEQYLWLVSRFPSHRLAWAFHLVAAEALYALKQTDRAVKQYEWVAENAPTRTSRSMAALRLGDVYLNRLQYDKALAAYYRMIEKYPAEAKEFPAIQINRAESLYGLGQYERAEAAFEAFLANHPGHPAGWRASLRIGEIIARRDGASNVEAARKSFLATINAYPFSPGSTVARLRLIPCGDHGGFTTDTAIGFFSNDTKKFTGDGEIAMEKFPELRAISRVRTLVLMSDIPTALAAAIDEREALSKKSPVYSWITGMERQLFRKQIVELMRAGQKFEAVSFYQKYSDRIEIKEAIPDEVEASHFASIVDPDYLLKLSRAASEMGLGTLAMKINNQYEEASIPFAAARGIATGSMNSKDMDARLKRAEKAYTEAKALWVQDKKAHREKVQGLLADIIDESPFSYQREVILGLIAESENKLTTALTHAKSAQLLLPPSSRYTREQATVDQWVVRLQMKSGNTRAAIDGIRKIRDLKVDEKTASQSEGLGVEPFESREKLLISEGDLSSKTGKWGDAARAYGILVKDGIGGNQAVYQYAMSLEKSKSDPKKVEALIEKVAQSDKDDFWRELARKRLASKTAKEGNKP